ncbi:MAG TPA: cytochrome c oxidase accessory protein CcoG [Steroidobacteraceae bacterium]|nr:cytochrome c oxidase accessory protein CcoG [Steroidobacteraceae bacterium]
MSAGETGGLAAGAAPGEVLYEAHRKVYAREVQGLFARLRLLAMFVLLGIFYGLPWLRWGGRQAVLFDLPARKFFLFGLTLFPQDFYLLTWLLVIAALSLFFFTALAGRLWCGYACPQTVWTESFVWMERLTEGSRLQQMKLDKARWGAQKIARKCAKQLLWVSFALFTGVTFVGYFSSIEGLLARLAGGGLGLSFWEGFWILFYALATYGNAGHLREQVCKYMCPYARFQSAMFDRDTLVVSYDAARGEPRGSRARGTARPAARGDCVDCMICVQVCPTGIDIRNGLQYECIACAACIDACDAVMTKIGSARGLVRYSTQAEMDHVRSRVLRPRTAIYGALLLTLISGFAYAVAHRVPFDLDVLRDRNTLYRELDDGRIENVYTVRIINKDQRPHRFVLSAVDLPNAVVDGDSPTYQVAAEDVRSVVVRVRIPPGQEHGGRDFVLQAQPLDRPGLHVASRARFFAEP